MGEQEPWIFSTDASKQRMRNLTAKSAFSNADIKMLRTKLKFNQHGAMSSQAESRADYVCAGDMYAG